MVTRITEIEKDLISNSILLHLTQPIFTSSNSMETWDHRVKYAQI